MDQAEAEAACRPSLPVIWEAKGPTGEAAGLGEVERRDSGTRLARALLSRTWSVRCEQEASHRLVGSQRCCKSTNHKQRHREKREGMMSQHGFSMIEERGQKNRTPCRSISQGFDDAREGHYALHMLHRGK
ncbi:hypothetical protein NCS56_00697200 [Fusarium sp. Ph1]|nr:hypothetical protein NCS56_00697200 [Fusarium sp. Ph1]